MSQKKHPKRIELKRSRRAVAPKIPIVSYALEWHRLGVGIVPLTEKGKEPARGYSSKKPLRSEAEIRRYFTENPKANYGVVTGSESGIIVLDIDGKKGRTSLLALTQEFGSLAKTTRVKTGRGDHYYFQYTEAAVTNSVGKLGVGIDIRGKNGYVVGPGSTHANGRVYEYREGRSLDVCPPAAMPRWLVKKARAPKSDQKPASLTPPAVSGNVVPEGGRNSHLASYAGLLVAQGVSGEALRTLVLLENDQSCKPPLDGEEVEKIIASVSRYAANHAVTDAGEELANEVLTACYAGGAHLLRLADGVFWAYGGKRWSPVNEEVLRGVILQQANTRNRASGQKTGLIKQVEFLLAAKVATTDDLLRFNSSPPPVINCRNGEVWIKADGSRELRPHSATSYLRHYIDIDYDPAARAPIYMRTVKEIFAKAPGRRAVIRFWHELMGYIIQPARPVPIIAIFKGGGSNGKTQLANTLSRLLGGDLVCAIRVQDLNRSQFSTASLLGKFLVIDDDVKAGTRLPDGDLKRISEEKMITAERKFGPAFSFTVRTVPMLLCNNTPSLADLSHGMQRRLTVLPFDRQFSEAEIDRTRFPRIWSSEMSGILNLALDGLQRVIQRDWKFKQPKCVRTANQALIREANPLPDFIADRCMKTGRCTIKQLYSAFESWSREGGLTLIMQGRTFKQNLTNLGFRVIRSNKGNEVVGLKLKSDLVPPRANHW